MTTPPNAPQTHIAGEMFVAAELAKRGYLVALTMGNAKAVDLFVERDGRTICVQVKAVSRRRHAGWPLPFDTTKIKPKSNLFGSDIGWVCVVLNEIDEPPTYFVFTPKDVLKLGDWYSTRAILNVSKAKAHEGCWNLIEEGFSRAPRIT